MAMTASSPPCGSSWHRYRFNRCSSWLILLAKQLPLSAAGLIFDLDGTLIDSVPDIGRASNRMLEQLGLPRASMSTLRTWVGNGAARLVKRALTGEVNGEPDEALFNQALPLFFDLYAQEVFVESRIYRGVLDTLDKFSIAGIAMACVTNKPARHTLPLLDQAGLSGYFDCVVAGDSLAQKKPDPAPLQFACEQLKLAVKDCIMIGDSASDIFAAKAAMMPVLCVTYGYNQGLDLSTLQPDALVGEFADLDSMIECSVNRV